MGKTQMWKITLLSAIVFTPIVFTPIIAVSPALAGENQSEAEQPFLESPAPLVEALMRQNPTCEVAQRLIAQNPNTPSEDGRLMGRVYSVVGDTVSLELENGETRHVTLRR